MRLSFYFSHNETRDAKCITFFTSLSLCINGLFFETFLTSGHEFHRQHYLADLWRLPCCAWIYIWRFCAMHHRYRYSLGNAML